MIRKRIESAVKLSAKDFAYIEVKMQIIEGKLIPDQSVVEADLSKELNISRTPLREALQRLEIENLIVRKQNGRLKIAPISVKEVTEIFTVRAKLEGIVTKEATNNASEKDLIYLEEIVEQLHQQHKTSDVDGVLYYGSEFHSLIYEISQNKTVIHILNSLNDHIHRYRRIMPHHKIQKTKGINEHQEILHHMMEGNGDAAQHAMERHIQQSLRFAVEAIEQYEKEKEGDNGNND